MRHLRKYHFLVDDDEEDRNYDKVHPLPLQLEALAQDVEALALPLLALQGEALLEHEHELALQEGEPQRAQLGLEFVLLQSVGQ